MKTRAMEYLLIGLSSLVMTACEERRDSPAMMVDTAVIYDGDSRQDRLPAFISESWYEWGSAVAMLVSTSNLTLQADGTWSVYSLPLHKNFPLCSDENFLTQPTLGFCSGTLVAPDVVLTAAHCVQRAEDCSETAFLFGWDLAKSSQPRITRQEVYKCKKILHFELTRRDVDYALVQLDRPVEHIRPLPVALEPSILRHDSLVSLSYPLGLPLKKDQARVLNNDEGKASFSVEVDTFHGSSGSPLLNTRGEIVGILVRGQDDITEDDQYRVQSEGGCVNFHRCENGSCWGETYFKTSRMSEAARRILRPAE
ncbi:MAG: serine protease [Bdellovibrio sp.]